MSETVRKIIGAFLISAAVLMVAAGLLPVRRKGTSEWAGRGITGIKVPEIPAVSESDPVNTGDLFELTELPGIGETIAGLIIEEREANGFFRYPEDLTAVRGIGGKKMEQIRPLLLMESVESEE